MEDREETIARLRQRLGREPTDEEISETRNALIRQRYAAMALAAMSFQDEADAYDRPHQSAQEADRSVQDAKLGHERTSDGGDKQDGELDWHALGIKLLDFRQLFDRVALADERFDDDWIDDVCEAMRAKGCLVGRQDWDSGGPGAGAGTVDVYQFRGLFIGEDDAQMYGPFDTFADAADAVGLFRKTDATTNIWVDPRFG
jgi:hypothetical protein